MITTFDGPEQPISRKRERSQPSFVDTIVGRRGGLRAILSQVEAVAPTNATVLITGETGTGKELIARAIHEMSPRRDRNLVKLNCAAMPSGLLESELFGHERGAFTGAVASHLGRFALADHGTLFLDEIGDMSRDLQPKLLRVLQEREFERVGGTRTIAADVRVIAATHRDLDAAVAQGTFRQDLFYRLQGVGMHLPTLRERVDDLPLLATHLLERAAKRLNRPPAVLSPEAMRCLWTYPWPGNVRELQHVLEGAMVMSDGVIHSEHLPAAIQRPAQPRPAAAENGPALSGSLDEALEEWERRMILNALSQTQGVQARAAKVLGISERSLWYRIKKLGIQVRTPEDGPPAG